MEHSEQLKYSDETICISHITDPVLSDRLATAVSQFTCSFCPRPFMAGDPAFALAMHDLAAVVLEAATWLFHDGHDEYFHEGFPEQYDTDHVVNETIAGAIEDSVFDDVAYHLSEAIVSPHAWVDSKLREDFLFSWESFTEAVRFQSRFVYLSPGDRKRGGNEPPERISEFLDGLRIFLREEMLTLVQPEEVLYRARMTASLTELGKDVASDPAKHLGPAPDGIADAGRLNAEGVGLFYAATSAELAVKETALHSPFDDALVGGFTVKRELTILDFTKRPHVPSVFSIDDRSRYVYAQFADDFVDKLTQTVRLAGSQRLDYVATQIVGEYFRWVSPTKLDGIAWGSHLMSERVEEKNVLVWANAYDVASEPPLTAEFTKSLYWMRSHGPYLPILTLSRADVAAFSVRRSVEVLKKHFMLESDPVTRSSPERDNS